MVYRVHTKAAQLTLYNDDRLPYIQIKPDSMKKEPNHLRFRRMVRKWNVSSKPKT
jgi:hypothetical protein